MAYQWAVHQLGPHKALALIGFQHSFIKSFGALLSKTFSILFMPSSTQVLSLNLLTKPSLLLFLMLTFLKMFLTLDLLAFAMSFTKSSQKFRSYIKTFHGYAHNTLPKCFHTSRNIIDNILLALEIFDTLRKKNGRKKGYGALKIDMCNAYDRVN